MAEEVAEVLTDRETYEEMYEFASKGDIEGLKNYLDTHGNDCINYVKDDKKNTILMFCASKGDWRLCEEVLNRGANINARNKDAYTALRFAAKFKQTEVVTKLMELGADVDNEDDPFELPENVPADHYYAMFEFISKNDLDGLKTLLDTKGHCVDMTPDARKNTILMFCSAHKDWSYCEALLNKGADINAINRDGVTPLIYAAKAKRPEIIQNLIERGADTEHRDNDLRNALDYYP